MAAGATDAGLQRQVNEDRFHVDAARGLFIVVDGVGGQAAGGKAADVALSMLRARLERQTGPTCERVREAITLANNEIHRAASTRPEWNGMACVLTVAVVEGEKATIGHVGDTRLYKLRDTRIEKITKDHSPVGEREDANEISEFQAMRHPRRNEVYRDVGSEAHTPADPEFVDLVEIPFEADAALLLCSDGLSDLVDSASIARIVRAWAGDPDAVVRSLIAAANAGGGKDNVTAVYVEGVRFATSQSAAAFDTADAVITSRSSSTRARLVRGAILVLLVGLAGFPVARRTDWFPAMAWPSWMPSLSPTPRVVQPGESIAAAVEQAAPGSRIVVEPGEYRERLVLKDGISLVSRVPRAATIRLPGAAADDQAGPAVIAVGVSAAELMGFKVVGDAATPLGVGILVSDSVVSIADVEIVGATSAGILFADAGGSSTLIGSEIHDNPGAGLVIDRGAAPRISQSVFYRNGMSEHARGSFSIQSGAAPVFQRNVFLGMAPLVFADMSEEMRRALMADNWFLLLPGSTPSRAVPSGGPPRGPR